MVLKDDIGRPMESGVSLRGGCSAAFSIPIGGQEQLIYTAELSDSLYSIVKLVLVLGLGLKATYIVFKYDT